MSWDRRSQGVTGHSLCTNPVSGGEAGTAVIRSWLGIVKTLGCFPGKGPRRPCRDLVRPWPGGGGRESSVAGDVEKALISSCVESLGVPIGEAEEL